MPTASSTPRSALSAPYRGIRPVRATDDAPFEGMLTTVESGDTCVLVDEQTLPSRWDGWSADPDGHLVAPLAIVRRSDGHDVALPALTERVEDFVARRRNTGAALSKGERVTLAVSVIRGLSEVADSSTVVGQWWLTPSGRPVLATGASTQSARENSFSLIRDITEDDASGPVWAEALTALSGAVDNPREFDRAEELLFTIAEPSPLTTSALGNTRMARDLASHTAESFDEIMMPLAPGLTERLARHVDADLADTFSRATTEVWRWLTRSRHKTSKRAPWLVAAAVTVTVLAAGLLWPTEGEEPATAELPAESAAATSSDDSDLNISPSETPLESAGADAAEPDVARSDADIAMAVDALLTRRADCEGDEACETAYAVDGGLLQPAGVIDQPSNQRTQTLIDEYGGVAVVQVAPRGGGESQIVVVELRNEEWLLRDVYDAEQ